MGHGSWQICEKQMSCTHVHVTLYCYCKQLLFRFVKTCSLAPDPNRNQTNSVLYTITDTRSRLSAEKVESVELIRWRLRACRATLMTLLVL